MYDDYPAYDPDPDTDTEIALEDSLLSELLYADGYDPDPDAIDWTFTPSDIDTDTTPIDF